MSQARRWAIGTAIAVVVILAAGWLLAVKPQKNKVADLKTQAQDQLNSNQLILTEIRALQAEQKQLPQQQRIEEKFSTAVPDTAAQPTLIRQLSAAAHSAGVDLSTITPGAATQISAGAAASQSLGATATPSGGVYQMPLSLSVSGSYANIEAFFSSLERMPRALLVSAFTLGPGSTTVGSGASTLSASITAAVFYSPGSAPIAVPTPSTTSTSTPGGTTAPAPVDSSAAAPTTPAPEGSSPATAISRPAIPLNPAN